MSFEKGFLKRANEHGLDKYQALDLLKLADKEPDTKRKAQGREYLPMNMMGALGDYLTPGGFGGYRAGKMTAMSKALNKQPSLASTNPISSSVLGSLLGAGGGAAFGNQQAGPEGFIGGMLGGGLLGAMAPAAIRRHEYKKNLQEFTDGAKVDPEKPNKLRGIGNIMLPFSGPHRKGEAVGYNKLRGVPEDESMNTALNSAQLFPPPVGVLSQLFGGHLQNYSADRTMDKTK